MKDKQTPNDFIKNYAKISDMDTTEAILLLEIQDKQCTKYSRIKTCLELWNSRDAEINELKSAFRAINEELKESNGEIDALKQEIKKRDGLLNEARDLIDYCACRTIYAHAKQARASKYMKDNNLKPTYGRSWLLNGDKDE